MPGHRNVPLHIIAGEDYHHQFTFHDSAGDPLLGVAGTSRALLHRGAESVEFGMQVIDSGNAVVLFTLDAADTLTMSTGLWRGGVEISGSTWVTWDAIVSEDPTP